MSYKLPAKLVPLLTKDKDGKHTVRLCGIHAGKAVLEFGDEVTAKIQTQDLGFELGKSLSATLEFDAAGVLLTHTLDAPPKTQRTELRGSSGSARPRQISQF